MNTPYELNSEYKDKLNIMNTPYELNSEYKDKMENKSS